MAEAATGWESVFQLVEAIRVNNVRVPVRKQEEKVVPLIALLKNRPVIGSVTTILPSYDR
jgi:hypothetical protein